MPSTYSKATLIAAGLMLMTLMVHVFAGGSDVHLPLLAETDNPGLAAFVSVLWHFVTLFLAVLCLGLVSLARHPNPALEAAFCALQLGFAALFLFYGTTRLGTVWLMPQWIVFLLVPALTRWGQSKAVVQSLS